MGCGREFPAKDRDADAVVALANAWTGYVYPPAIGDVGGIAGREA
jgi:hypothetical protein